MFFNSKISKFLPIASLNVIPLLVLLPHQKYCSEEKPFTLDSFTCGFDYVTLPSEGFVDSGTLPWIAGLITKMGAGQAMIIRITSAVVVHQRFAVSSAARVVDMTQNEFRSSSYLIIGTELNKAVKQQLENYVIHPEYYDGFQNTLALIEIRQSRDGLIHAVPCLPQLYLEYDQLSSYALALSWDQNGDVMRKEAYSYKILKDSICKKYYEMAGLTFPNIDPKHVICGNSPSTTQPCVWDTGIILIAKNLVTQKWLFLGYGIRGLGCSVPARFINTKQYVTWIQTTLTQQYLRRKNPESIVYFSQRKAKEFIWNKYDKEYSGKPGNFNYRYRIMNKTLGTCGSTMNVLYSDEAIIHSNVASTSRGYYNVSEMNEIENNETNKNIVN